MATEDDYDDRRYGTRHLERDIRDAHVSAAAAKMMATLALIGAAIAITLAVMAWNKANDAWGNAQRAVNLTQAR